jgi:hypothetical protein
MRERNAKKTAAACNDNLLAFKGIAHGTCSVRLIVRPAHAMNRSARTALTAVCRATLSASKSDNFLAKMQSAS